MPVVGLMSLMHNFPCDFQLTYAEVVLKDCLDCDTENESVLRPFSKL